MTMNHIGNGDSRESEDKLLLEPFTYLTALPGKNVRKKLLAAFNHWLKVPLNTVEEIGAIVQMLHHASLLIDDIEDSSLLRRGLPVAHKIYGVPSTINSANYVMFQALERVLRLEKPEAVSIFSEQMLELHRGQGMEIYWRDRFVCPTEEEYRAMTVRKTGNFSGGLFNLAVRLMQLFSANNSHDRDFAKLSSLMGLYFQVRDDYANLCLEEYANNKSFAEDLTEGKYSFPIIYAIREKKSERLQLILRQRTTEVDVKQYAVNLLREAGAFDYTKSVLTELDASLRKAVADLGGNPGLITLLDELKNWDR